MVASVGNGRDQKRLEGGMICVEFSKVLVSCGGFLNSEEQCVCRCRRLKVRTHQSNTALWSPAGGSAGRQEPELGCGGARGKDCLSFNSFVLCRLKACSVDNMCILNLAKALNLTPTRLGSLKLGLVLLKVYLGSE